MGEPTDREQLSEEVHRIASDRHDRDEKAAVQAALAGVAESVNPVMYLFLNKGLKMSTGKAAAQAAHAAVLAADAYSGWADFPNRQRLYDEWMDSGHYTKLVLEARDAEHLFTIDRYLADRGIKTFMVIDEGRTEIAAHSPTALACEIVDKNDPRTPGIFEGFDLYQDKRRKRR